MDRFVNNNFNQVMARQKEFDRDDALRSAMQVFSEQGFGSTTTNELRHAMGIGRQSFYDTFKGKKEIYAEVLRLYTNEHTGRTSLPLFRPHSDEGSKK